MIGLIKEVLVSAEKEDLFGPSMGTICYDGYQLALQTKRLREAKRFSSICQDQYLLGTGLASEQTQKMTGYVQDPTSHVLWYL
jgi:hypothetical protein